MVHISIPKRVFLDTNLLIDLICSREPFVEKAQLIFALGYSGKVSLLISALSFVNTIYVARKYDFSEIREKLSRIAAFVEVVDLSAKGIMDALSSGWKDYEDSLQHQSAVQSHADCIVTRNTADFASSSLPVYSPEEFLALPDVMGYEL